MKKKSLSYDRFTRRLKGPAGSVQLSAQQGAALAAFLQHKELTREGLFQHLFSSRLDPPSDKSLDVLIYRLRSALEATNPSWQIKTIWAAGWTLVEGD